MLPVNAAQPKNARQIGRTPLQHENTLMHARMHARTRVRAHRGVGGGEVPPTAELWHEQVVKNRCSMHHSERLISRELRQRSGRLQHATMEYAKCEAEP